jgi:hypothetical protein
MRQKVLLDFIACARESVLHLNNHEQENVTLVRLQGSMDRTGG